MTPIANWNLFHNRALVIVQAFLLIRFSLQFVFMNACVDRVMTEIDWNKKVTVKPSNEPLVCAILHYFPENP